jgi:hypothetical protein
MPRRAWRARAPNADARPGSRFAALPACRAGPRAGPGRVPGRAACRAGPRAGSGRAPGARQPATTAAIVATAGQAALALFTHRPLFYLSPDEQEVSGRFVNPQPRGMLLAALGSAKPALIGSGHVHQFVSHDRWGSHHIWAPSTGFILPAASQPHYGLKQTGYVEHVLNPDGSHFSRIVKVRELASPSITDFPDAYAQYAAPAKPQSRDTATEVGPS